MSKLVLVPLAIAAAMAFTSSTALAGTATYAGGEFTFTAAPGEANTILMKNTNDCDGLPAPCFEFSDPFYSIGPPAGCVTAQFVPGVHCPIPAHVTIHAGDLNDLVYGWDGPSEVDGGPGGDMLAGGGGDDELFGGSGDDNIIGGPGDDGITGADGNDWLEEPILDAISDVPDNTAGSDSIAGGNGKDVISYAAREDPLEIYLDGNDNDGARGEGDIVGTDIEVVNGGQANDALVGNDYAQGLFGLGGDDELHGFKADDDLDGGPGSDIVLAGEGADKAAGGDGDDVVDGGPGQDILSGENLGGCKVVAYEYCVGGVDELRARDGEKDVLSCGPGTDHAIIDRLDVPFDADDCDQVDHVAPPEQLTVGKTCRKLAAPRASRKVCARMVKSLAMCEALGLLSKNSRCTKRAFRRASKDCRRLRGRRNRSACARWVGAARKRAGTTVRR